MNVLPRAGGLLDQPNREMQLLEAYLVAYVEWEELESNRRKAKKRK